MAKTERNEVNKLPIVLAGPDQVITLPTDSVSLGGASSSGPDGTISELPRSCFFCRQQRNNGDQLVQPR